MTVSGKVGDEQLPYALDTVRDEGRAIEVGDALMSSRYLRRCALPVLLRRYGRRQAGLCRL